MNNNKRTTTEDCYTLLTPEQTDKEYGGDIMDCRICFKSTPTHDLRFWANKGGKHIPICRYCNEISEGSTAPRLAEYSRRVRIKLNTAQAEWRALKITMEQSRRLRKSRQPRRPPRERFIVPKEKTGLSDDDIEDFSSDEMSSECDL